MKINNHNKCSIFVSVAQLKSYPRFAMTLNSFIFPLDNFPKSTVNMKRNSI